MKRVLALSLFLFATLSLFAQTDPNPALNVATNNGQFTLSANVVALSTKTGMVPATDVGATFAITKNVSLRSDNIIASGVDAQSYFGGVQYFLSSSKLLSKTNFDPSTFQFYLTASGGVVRAAGFQHPGFLAGGGINYDPTHTSKFSVTLIDVRAARLPYIANGVVAVVSGGVKLGW